MDQSKPPPTRKVPAAAHDELFLSDDEEIECLLCYKIFSSVQMYEQHLNSKKHHQMLKKKKLMQQVGTHDEEDELFCDICKKTISGYTPYLAHLKGSGHAKSLKQQRLKEALKNLPEVLSHDNKSDDDLMPKPFAECAKCQKIFYGPEALQQHLKGPSHRKKLKNLKTLDSLKDCEVDNEKFVCKICKKYFSGPIPYKIHLRSAVHKKEEDKTQIEEQIKDHFKRDETGLKLICKECGKVFTDPLSFKSHLENNSHGKQRAKDVVFDFVSENPDIVAVKALRNQTSDQREDYQPGQYFLVCKLCHKSFSGPQSALDHIESKKHIKTKTEKRAMKTLKQKQTEEASSLTLSKRNGVNAPEANHEGSDNSQ